MTTFFKATTLALSVAFTAAAGADARELKLATVAPAASAWAQATKEFGRIVEENSEGDLTVKVFTDAQLGGEADLFTGMKLGTVDMNYTTVGILALFDKADVLKITFAPYLFDNSDEALRILNSDYFGSVYDKVAQDTGIRIFAVSGIRSPRAIQTTKGPISKPEDVKGLKIRVPGVDIFERTFQVLGAQTVPMGSGEIYTALSRHVIDGQDNGFDFSVPLKYHEVAKYWSETDHVYTSTGWMISEKVWQALSADEQALLRDAGLKAGEIMTQDTKKLDEEARATLEEAGVEITVPDREAFRAAFAGLYEEFEGKAWPAGMVADIRAMQSE